MKVATLIFGDLHVEMHLGPPTMFHVFNADTGAEVKLTGDQIALVHLFAFGTRNAIWIDDGDRPFAGVGAG